MAIVVVNLQPIKGVSKEPCVTEAWPSTICWNSVADVTETQSRDVLGARLLYGLHLGSSSMKTEGSFVLGDREFSSPI